MSFLLLVTSSDQPGVPLKESLYWPSFCNDRICYSHSASTSCSCLFFVCFCAFFLLFCSWFESDVLKATLATDAVIGAATSPKHGGSAYVLLHHVMGEAAGKKGVWAYVKGGMGAITQALAKSAVTKDVTIITDAVVEKIDYTYVYSLFITAILIFYILYCSCPFAVCLFFIVV